MTTDIQTAARALMEAAERARTIRMQEIDEERIECVALIGKYDKARERLALLDAEYARVEAQSTADIARQALEPAQEQPKPEPYRAGLPPKCPACGKQPDRDALPLTPGEHVRCQSCQLILRVVDGAWQIVRPVENCGHVAEDGTCGHPNAQTPECHDGVVCPVKAEKAVVCAVCRDTHKMERGEKTVNCTACPRPCSACDRAGYCKTTPCDCRCHATPPAPTLLDLTKLPPGTVCEALGAIRRASMPSIIVAAGELFRIHNSDAVRDEMAMIETYGTAGLGYWVPALVPARVVKEGGEDARE